ncbi:MAG: ATP-binding protein [Candidatus Eisenbacteria bacterium]
MAKPGRIADSLETVRDESRSAELQRMIELADLGTWVVELASGTAERSPRTLRYLGVPPEDGVRLEAWQERLHPADRTRVEEIFAGACDPAGEGRFAAEYRVVHADGTVHWLADRGWTEFEGSGAQRRAARVVGVLCDITAATRVKQRLAVEHEVTRALAHAAGFEDAIPALLEAILDGVGASFCAYWLPEPDDQGLRCAHFVAGGDAPSLEPFVAASRALVLAPGQGLPGRVMASGKAAWIPSLAHDGNFLRSAAALECGLKSGVAMPVPGDRACLGVIEWFSREPLADDPDLLPMMEALGAEVGQFLLRARAEQARRDSDERHQLLYEAGRLLGETLDAESIYERMRHIVSRTVQVDGLVVSSFDEADRLIRCEHAWADGVRLAPESLPPLPFNPDAGMQSEVIATREPRIFHDVKARARNPRGTFYQAAADGSLQRITGEEPTGTHCAIMVPLLLGGRVTGVVQIMSDAPGAYGDRELGVLSGVVSQLAVALQNARLYRRLKEADRRKDEFLATLSHELRNPLAPVRTSLEIMKISGGDAELLERARSTMERQLAQMVRLIDDLLDVGRITSNKLELQCEPVELGDILRHAIETSSPVLTAAGHLLEFEPAATPIPLHADPVRLNQIFTNLIVNAAKFTPRPGTIEMRVERRDGQAIVSVADNGIGIPVGMLERVFDPFVQVDTSVERARGGLGLGLSLVKRLVEMHGGSARAHSDGAGLGSRFEVRLPCDCVAAHAPGAAREVDVAAPLPPSVILIADDNHDGAESLALLLGLEGHDTHTVHDGLQAVEVAGQLQPDVVLLDIGMPKMSGHEACAAMRRQAWGRRALILATTGWGQADDRRRSEAAGFDAHLVKPVDPAELMRTLTRLRIARGDAGRPG